MQGSVASSFGRPDLGCAYVVRISPYDLGAALPLLRREGLGPLRIYVQRGGDIQEVGL